MHSALWAATSRITGPSVIALPIVPVTVTHTRIIATTIEVIAVDVDAGGVGVGRGVVKVALAVDVVLARAAIGWSEVAVVIRVLVAIHLLTCARIVHQRSIETTESITSTVH